MSACRHRQHTGQGRAIKLTPEGVARALPGHLGHLAQAQLTRVHQVRIGDARYGGWAKAAVTDAFTAAGPRRHA
jgi:hypothetical protein